MSANGVEPYAGYDVLAKWDTPSFDDRTRDALARRLRQTPPRRFFDADAFALLASLVERLAPPLQDLAPELLALWIDARLHDGVGEGFRNDGAPPERACWRRGLAAIDEESRRRFAAGFVDLDADAREAVLAAVQRGEVDPAFWRGLDPAGFFADTLLKTIAGLAYAHPLAWSDIGFGGPASPRGYVRLGFDARDPWEAKERR